MANQESIIRAWKNPGIRGDIEGFAHPAGDAILELEAEDLAAVQGGALAYTTDWITSLVPPIEITTMTIRTITFNPVTW